MLRECECLFSVIDATAFCQAMLRDLSARPEILALPEPGQDADACGFERCFDAEPPEHVRAMNLDGAWADVQQPRYVLVAEPIDQAVQNLSLASA
jgi:hypothetical protein